MKQNKRNYIIIGLCSILLIMTVGYATTPYKLIKEKKIKSLIIQCLLSVGYIRINEKFYSFFWDFCKKRCDIASHSIF